MTRPELLWPAEAELGEGVCWSPSQQALYWVDIYGQRLHRWRAGDGARRSWDFDDTISTVCESADGQGLVVTLRHDIARFDPLRPAAPVLLHRPPEEPPGNRFNDGKCDRLGHFWAGTMDFDCRAPTGALYRLGSDGRVKRHLLGFPVTNGPAWSADGRTMWVNDTVGRTVHAFDVDLASGRLSNPRPWLRLADGDGLPDGMTTDAEGRLWICHWGGGCVSAHDPRDGRELERITLPVSQVTNCCFGGSDYRTLFITSARHALTQAQLQHEPLAGALFAAAMSVPGRAAGLYG